jgi:hypothetical protein
VWYCFPKKASTTV